MRVMWRRGLEMDMDEILIRDLKDGIELLK